MKAAKNLTSSSFLAVVLLAAFVASACGGGKAPLADGGVALDAGLARDGGAAADAGVADGGLVAVRPYGFKVPVGYDARAPTPLVILLHGFGADGAIQSGYFGLSPLADDRTFLYAFPNGTPNARGERFWNATDACCAGSQNVDDVAYIRAIIDDVQSRYNVDPKRIFLIGHSNGGFMSYRMACELSGRIAAIATLAGAMWKDATKCRPTEPVGILQIHGDMDETILYDGGATSFGQYPSARETVAGWATNNGCTSALLDPGVTLDLVDSIGGAETRVERYEGCRANGAVELWTIVGGPHIPFPLQPSWPRALYDFLSAHAKP